MVAEEQGDVLEERLPPFRWMHAGMAPVVEAAPLDCHDSVKPFDWELPGKLGDYLVFFLTRRKYSLFALLPFTMYPFFSGPH
ncbi:hypothetical protein [Mitsuokella sp.]|uniref:hypothetical protein n=1 Tax=Mitsuokella sp. TaxID=2049034 RepID=UPI002A8006B1|nr:hypothetical protein [Mitsuokella sp.]MDY4475073.1 hypothetical protein [Mitsuokella sp.]